MTATPTDLYSVLRAIAEEWEQCQVDLKKHVIMCVRTFLSTTERDQDGHRILPMDRLDEAEREVQSHAASIRKLRDCACERLAFELRGDWSPKDVILCLETRAPTLETAIEAMPKPWHAFIIEQLREDFPEQLAAIEAKHHVGGPVEPQPAIAEQSPSQPLANENEGVAKREKQKRGPSEKVVNAEMAKIAKQLKPLKVAMMTADQWQVALERVGISTSIRTIDRTEVYKEAKEKSHRFRDRSSVKAERAGDLVHQLADEEVQTTKRRSPKSSRRLA